MLRNNQTGYTYNAYLSIRYAPSCKGLGLENAIELASYFVSQKDDIKMLLQRPT